MTDVQHNGSITVELTEAQRAYVDGLHELADTLAAHPDVWPDWAMGHYLPIATDGDVMGVTARAFGGRWEKNVVGEDFHLDRQFGPHRISLYTPREAVCERIQVGTRKVQKPDPDVPEPPTIEVDEPVYEWRCKPLLGEADTLADFRDALSTDPEPSYTDAEEEAWREMESRR